MKITRITNQNIEAFSDVLPMELWEQKERLFLGAISDEKEAIACMSAAIYSNTVSIDWLYTLPSRREQGAASELIETIRVLVNDLDIILANEFGCR